MGSSSILFIRLKSTVPTFNARVIARGARTYGNQTIFSNCTRCTRYGDQTICNGGLDLR